MAREVDEEAKDRMEIRRNESGWMNRNIFMNWLIDLDKQLQRPTLLLMDSCPAHNKIDTPDPTFGYRDNWKFLTIQRLPKNSTSVTQPLDAGIISVFKRALLDLLSRETSLVKTYDKSKAISNGHAWSLVPFAWNKVKASTVRNCFAKTPVLPDDMRQQLRQRTTAPQEQRENIQYSRRNDYEKEARAYFEHLIAEVNEASNWKWTFKPQGTKDVQDLADETLAAEPAVEEMVNDPVLLAVSSLPCPPPYDTDEWASSPLAEDVYARGMQVLKERAPALGLMSVDELKATRRLLSGGSAEEVRLSKVLKEVVRSYGEAKNLGGPVEQSEAQPVTQPLHPAFPDSDNSYPSLTNPSKTSYRIDDGSNTEYVVDGKQCGQGEVEGIEENDEEDDEERQWMEKELFELQYRQDGEEEEVEEEEEEEESLQCRDHGVIITFAEEEERTADYSNYSGHAGDESNSESDYDNSNNINNINNNLNSNKDK